MLLTFIGRNLLRRPLRSALTAIGIAVGVAAVVALIGVALEFQRSWERVYTARDADLVVAKIISRDPFPAVFRESMREEIAGLPGVRRVAAVLDDLMSVEEAPLMLVFGWEWRSFVWDHLRLLRGRWPTGATEPAAVIGSVAADLLKKKIGDQLQIEAGRFEVVGIFESPAFLENGAVIMALPRFQELTENAGKIRYLNLRLEEGATAAALESLQRQIRARFPDFRAYSAGEIGRDNSAMNVINAMTAATSGLALLVGAIGIMNTILMSVFERTQEIGILVALGWRRRRIVAMILGESFLLSLAGGVGGILLGKVFTVGIALTPFVRGKIEGHLTLPLMAAAMALAIGVGFLGGLYPAWRAANLHPQDALHRV